MTSTEPITVTSQEELDAALADHAPAIVIRSPRGVWLTIGDTGDSDVTIAGQSTIKTITGRVEWVGDSGRVEWVVGSGRVEWVGDSGSVGEVGDSGSVGRVVGSGRVGRVVGSGSVGEVGDSGRVGRVGDSGSVGEVGDSGRVGRVGDSGRVGRVVGSGSVGRVVGSGRVGRVGDSGSVGEVGDSGSVEWVGDSGRVGRASGTASVHLHDRATLERAGSHVAVFLHSGRATYEGGHLIDLTTLDETDPGEWADHHALGVTDDGMITVYKAVRDDFRSQRDFVYPVGEPVSCDDWRDDADCGGGLHFSPSPAEARKHDASATRYLECTIRLAEARPIRGGTAKIKAKSATVVREVDVHGQPVAPAAEAVTA